MRRATFYKGVDYVICTKQWEAICTVKGQKYIIPNCQGQNEKDVAQRLRRECKKLIQEGHQLEPDNGALCILIDAERKALVNSVDMNELNVLHNIVLLDLEKYVLCITKYKVL